MTKEETDRARVDSINTPKAMEELEKLMVITKKYINEHSTTINHSLLPQ